MGKIWKDIASNVMVPEKYKTEKISHQIWSSWKGKIENIISYMIRFKIEDFTDLA